MAERTAWNLVEEIILGGAHELALRRRKLLLAEAERTQDLSQALWKAVLAEGIRALDEELLLPALARVGDGR